ncbi:MAG: YitT family protein [Gudongella sp.]|nr:YitT family protein [Gudongella sp.]
MILNQTFERDKKKILKKLFFIVFGNLLCAIAFNAFFIPSQLLSGGVGGLALMVRYLWDVPTGITVLLINIPIFILGAKMVDREFIIYAFISMLVFSSLLTVTTDISKYFVIDDIILGAIFGGVLNGLGMGLMFRNRTCQGGLDIIATILKQKRNLNISTGLMTLNTIIVSLSSILFGFKSAMYTIIAMYVGYQVLDKVQMGFNVRKNVFIISDKSEELASQILTNLHRGVTLLEGTGAYTKQGKKVIYCIVTSNEIVKLKVLVDKIDPGAFLTINDVVEVRGSGFQNEGI